MQEGDNILLSHPATGPRGKLSPGQGEGSGPWRRKKACGQVSRGTYGLASPFICVFNTCANSYIPRASYAFINPFVLTHCLDHICQLRQRERGIGEALMLGPALVGPPHPGQARWVWEETVLHTQANTCPKNAYGFSGVAGQPAGNSASTFELPVT